MGFGISCSKTTRGQEWDKAAYLPHALKERELLPVISRQIVVMAEIAWEKHRWLQLSMLTGCAGDVCIVLAAVVLRFL